MTIMPRINLTDDRPTVLPPHVSAFLRRRCTELAGLSLVGGGVAVLLALFSFNPADPSWNTASEAVHHNWLGGTGATIADVLLQGLGHAAYVLPLVALGWGYKILRHQPLRRWGWRLLFTVLATLLLAGATAGLPARTGWPLGVLPGGAVGIVVLDSAAGLMPGAWADFSSFWPAALCFILASVMVFPALGFSYRQWGRAVVTVGRLLLVAALLTRYAFQLVWAKLRSGATVERPLLIDREFARPKRSRAPVAEEEYEEEYEEEEVEQAELFEDEEEEAPAPVKRAKKRKKAEWRGGSFEFPPHDLLKQAPTKLVPAMTDSQLEETSRSLESVLADFGVEGNIVNASPGPVVTLFELEPAPGTKSARVIALSDDIARQMSALSVRVATVPGRNVLGLELPNQKRETVYLRELLEHNTYAKTQAKLALVLGKDIGGEPIVADLARMPHLLVAGTTGSGKSVAINTMILSLLYRLSPEQVRFIMVDPKMLELSIYEGIPHLLAPVVTEPKKAVVALKWTVREMEDRYRAMSKLGVRNIDNYNERIREARQKNEVLTRRIQTGFDADTGKPVFEEQPIDLIELPSIVVIVDEMADLMLVAGKEVEASIQRLAQMARAAGIHLIMATQRPSVDVITGTIKANFPTRISFQVTSKIDSRTILGEQGAEQLLGQGDMLYMAGGGRITRVHGPFVSDNEVESIVRHLKLQGEPSYVDAVTVDADEGGSVEYGEGEGSGDDLYDKAVALVLRDKKASTSYIQRCLQIGYNRAARLIDRMESEGVISAPNHVGKREILVGSGVG